MSNYGNVLMSMFFKLFQSEYEAHKNRKLLLVYFCTQFPLSKYSSYNILPDTPQNLYIVFICLTEFLLAIIIFIQNFTYSSTNTSLVIATKQKFKFRFCINTIVLFYIPRKNN